MPKDSMFQFWEQDKAFHHVIKMQTQAARSTETRFVIITHNPITMARMNRLFGVTMAEQGVSQLVSVDLEMAEQIREAG
ncbi:MAG: hypothetical protein WCC66_13735 [Rhizobiaceae bacterium]